MPAAYPRPDMFDSLDAPDDLGSARARVLAAAERLAGTGPIARLGPDRETWSFGDAVVVVADGILWQADQGELAALAAALGPDRFLVFLEPTADLGWRQRVNGLGRSLWRRRLGHDFDTDVPAVLRSAGLEVLDLRRFGVGRRQLRSYAMGRAIALSPGRS